MFTEHRPEIKYCFLPPARTSRLNITTSHTLKYPSNEAMNNSGTWSATSSTANGLWLQVMKLVSGPGLIFPHFLSSQCKWRGNQFEVLICGVERGVNCSFGHSRGHTSTLPYCSQVISSRLPARRSRLCSVLVISASAGSFSQVKGLPVEGLSITEWFYGLFFFPPFKHKHISGRLQELPAGRSPRQRARGSAQLLQSKHSRASTKINSK